MFWSKSGSGFREPGDSHLPRIPRSIPSHGVEGGGGGKGGTDHIIIPLSSIYESCELLEAVFGIFISTKKLPFYKKITVFDSLDINFSKNRRDDPDTTDCMTESIFTRLI